MEIVSSRSGFWLSFLAKSPYDAVEHPRLKILCAAPNFGSKQPVDARLLSRSPSPVRSTFAIIIFIGLYMGRKEDNLEDFALGGRRIPWWAVLASIIAAETSAGTFFGTPGEGFALRNFTYLQLAFGTILARILVSYIFIKPYYDYKVYLDLRIPDRALRRRDQERCFRRFHDHAPARLRCALVRRGHRPRPRL